MIPRTIKSNLARLRRRERLIRLFWGATRLLAVVCIMLLAACLTDYIIDRDRDTPWSVRYVLFGIQAFVAMLGVVFFVFMPQLRRMRDPEMALLVEAHAPYLEHRLISAVELNQPGARIEGMSEELIVVVTKEAERLSTRITFPRIADHRRLLWGAAVVMPALLVMALPALIWPNLAFTLLQRQALIDIDVPRLVQLESVTPKVWPIGKKIRLIYHVTGPVDEDSIGEVLVTPEGQPRDRFELTFLGRDGGMQFAVDLPPSTLNIAYTARIGDGRTRKPDHVKFVPPPVVTKQDAWIQLPAFCGVTPAGKRYEIPQGHGDVVGIPGSSVRIAIETQKPIRGAFLEILRPDRSLTKSDEAVSTEKHSRNIKMTIGDSGMDAEAAFDLQAEETAYRIVVSDEYGFPNDPAPRRSLRMIDEEAPQVALLKDYFGEDADNEFIEDMPVLLGAPIRIPYVCHGPFGLGVARLLYRVLPKRESESDPVRLPEWVPVALEEKAGTVALGPFNPMRGIFKHSSVADEIPFHAVPSPNPWMMLGRTIGGGRYFLQTKDGQLLDEKGIPLKLKKGDQVEYCIEVYADKDINAKRPSAKSETRVATLVSAKELAEWWDAMRHEEEQLRKLEKGQRNVFGN